MKKFTMFPRQFDDFKKETDVAVLERTAYRPCHGHLNFDVYLQTWPNRASMAKSIRMQGKRMPNNFDWRAIIKLNDGEGY